MKRKASIFLILAVVLLLGNAETQTGRLNPALEGKLQKLAPGNRLAVIIELTDQVRPSDVTKKFPTAPRKERARAVVNALKNLADRSQGSLIAYLRQQQSSGAAERVRPFWIFNGVAVTATEPLIRSLAARPEVREIRLDGLIPLPSPSPAAASESSLPAEWNITLIRAPEVWAINPSYNGAGAVVGSFDTGVDISHPDLYSRYRGNHQISWFDPYDEHGVPFDAHGHGTHTTGIAVGGDAGGSSIGVAPGATWIAAKAWNDAGTGQVSAFHQIAEWFLSPGGDLDKAPDVVNCSWGFSESGCDAEFQPDVQAWRAAGIFPVFAAGNDGPAPGSVCSPGAYPMSFAVGATDYTDTIADFSGRGPSPCDNSIKPDVSAPGDGILSAVPGGYEILSGTSVAAPHVTGSVAVLRSINPALTVDQLESALTSGAKDLEDPGPDNSSGAGRLDLFVSGQIAIKGPNFPVVKILATEFTASEAGPISGHFGISRTGNDGSDLEVKYSIAGTAASGSDYIAIPETAIIPAGSSMASIEITPIDDTLAELDETVILTISSDSAYIVSASDRATITIKSDELISDLTISTMSVPTIAGAGQSVAVSETTKNTGAGSSDPSLTQLYLSADNALDQMDAPIGSRSVPVLASGATSSGSTTVIIPSDTLTGTWYIIAKADAEEVVTETSESNNTQSRPVKIGPDLDITAMSAPATAGAGQTIAVSDTTKNSGGGAADPCLNRLYLSANSVLEPSDVAIGNRSVPALAAGASNSGSATAAIPQGTTTGTWYIIVKADADGTVRETSESNNTYARSINIGPDLDITAMSAPAAAGTGQTIAVSDTTKNGGGGTADPTQTQFYLSANSTWDQADTSLGSRNVPALTAGSTSSGSTTITIPQGTATGTWYIIGKADANGAVAELSESNNTYSLSIKIGPDLTVTSITAPATAGAGQTITVSDTTKNGGGGTADPTLTKFYLSANNTLDASDALLGSRNVPALTAGSTSSGSTTITVPQATAAGSSFIIAKADGGEIVAETSESNNTLARSIKIGPDLGVTTVSAPLTAGEGQNIAISDTTRNAGGGSADPTLTKFYFSADSTLDAPDALLGSRTIPALAAGASSSGSISAAIPMGTIAGTWYIIARADAEGTIIETSETNNTFARSIKIGPDLDIMSVSAPTKALPGQTITVSDTTKNTGGGPAGSSLTQFYFSANSIWDSSDILIGSRSVPALAVGASNSGSTTVTIPQGTALGTWYIIAKADAEGVVAEIFETNNTYARSIKISGS